MHDGRSNDTVDLAAGGGLVHESCIGNTILLRNLGVGIKTTITQSMV